MGAEMERVQRERDAALERLAAQASSSEAADDQMAATRKQLRQVEVRSDHRLLFQQLAVQYRGVVDQSL